MPGQRTMRTNDPHPEPVPPRWQYATFIAVGVIVGIAFGWALRVLL